MKLKALKINNFAKFTDFEIEYDSTVTRLVGANGSGKTTVGLTGIWACLKGIAERGKDGQLIGERFRFLQNGKTSADLELTLVDEKAGGAKVVVKNHITASSNKITFETPENYVADAGWLENLLSVALMSAKNFSQLDARAQALALGIDTSEYDEKLKGVKEEFSGINREYRGLGDTPQGDKVERVSVAELVKEKDKVDRANRERAAQRNKNIETEAAVDAWTKVVADLSEKLENAKLELSKSSELLKNAPEVPPDIPTDEIVRKIQGAETTNAAAAEWERAEEVRAKKEKLLADLEENKKQQKFLKAQRTSYVKKALKVEVPGLEVDENGGLALNGKPIREPYFSKGELEVAVARIYAATNPELKVRFLDDFDVLDDTNQSEIIIELLDAGFQVITAETKREEKGPGIVVLRECKAAGEIA